ncbi:hypothetical protein [Levilactobacillus lindianensis]|nr:hypothetical protein [Levilactobacillus lindianensis]
MMWVILVVVAVLVIGLIGVLLMKHHSDAKQAELKTELASVRSESKAKQSESVKAASASRVSAKQAKKAAESSQAAADSASASSDAQKQADQSSRAETKKSQAATGSIKNAIQKYFTAYQIFVVTEKTDKQRAQEMGKYATSSAVEDLITKRQQNQADQASVKGTYSWTRPMQITRNGGQSYTVVLYYTLVVNHNSSKYKDTYSVETNGKELTHVKQESAEAL